MPAIPESSLSQLDDPLPHRVALIAGGGQLPARFVQACDANGIEVFIVGFSGQTEDAVLQNRNHTVARLGAAGSVIKTLRAHGLEHLVFVGSIRRPSLTELRPDFRTTRFFLKIGMNAIGDDGLLQAMRKELEKEGFQIHGVHKFLKDSLAVAGQIGRVKPGKAEWSDILQGAAVARAIGSLDIGQSVIIQQGMLLGVEAAEGTDELIRRCASYKRAGRGPILVKAAKPQQDRDLDLPTIGPDTVRLCAENGMAGIAVEAGHSLVLDPTIIAEMANRHKMFVLAADFPHVP